MKEDSISIILPIFNERNNILSLVEELLFL